MIVTVGAGTGVLAGGANLSFDSRCPLNPAICTIISKNNPPIIMMAPGDIRTASWVEGDSGPSSSVSGAQTEDSPYLGVRWTFTYGGEVYQVDDNGTWGDTGPGLANRCDSNTDYDSGDPTVAAASVTPAASVPDACVDNKSIPTLVYDSTKTPKVAPVAQHVFDAEHALPEHWGVPSSGNPLERVSNEQRDTNRCVACDSQTPPADWPTPDYPPTCDEYPLASSAQGGAGASIAWVPLSANSSQGATTRNFYYSNRIVVGDKFWVQAILPDGVLVVVGGQHAGTLASTARL